MGYVRGKRTNYRLPLLQPTASNNNFEYAPDPHSKNKPITIFRLDSLFGFNSPTE